MKERKTILRSGLRVFKSKWFDRFARKEKVDDTELLKAIVRADHGSVDADLGGGVIKQRIARQGKGKSGGYRTIVLFRHDERAVFMYGFPKNERGNISTNELKQFREAAKHMFALTEDQILKLLEQGDFVEVKRHG